MATKGEFREIVKRFGERHGNVTELAFLKDDPEGFSLAPIDGKGLVNQIYLVTSADGQQKAVLKYAAEHAFGEGVQHLQLSLGRQKLEYNAYKLLDQLAPGCAAKPYAYDKDLHIVAMEYLDMQTVGDTIINEGVNMDLAAEIGKVLSKMHYTSHKRNFSPTAWQQILDDFDVDGLREKITKMRVTASFNPDTGDTIFVVPESGVHIHEKYQGDPRVRVLEEKYTELLYRQDCLSHGDAHMHSFMSDGKDVKMIDMEFSWPGFALFDLVRSMTFYMFCCRVHSDQNGASPEVWQNTKEAVKTMVDSYLEGYGNDLELLGPSWIQNMAMLLGLHLVMTSIFGPLSGLFSMEEVAKVRFMTYGYELAIQHKEMKSVDDIIDFVFSDELKST